MFSELVLEGGVGCRCLRTYKVETLILHYPPFAAHLLTMPFYQVAGRCKIDIVIVDCSGIREGDSGRLSGD